MNSKSTVDEGDKDGRNAQNRDSSLGDYPMPSSPEMQTAPQKANAKNAASEPAGITLKGAVLDVTTKTPIQTARIQILDGDMVIERTLSEQDGAYRFHKLLGDEVQIKAIAKGYMHYLDSVSLSTDPVQEYDIALTPVNGVGIHLNNITGRDYPLSTVTSTEISTNKVVYKQELKNGTYDIRELTEGPYIIKAESHDKQTTVSARAAAGGFVVLTLKPFARMDILLIIHRTNEGLKKGEYRYTYESKDGETTITDWIAVPGDTFSMENLRPGTYQIEARSKTHYDNDQNHISRSRTVHLKDGDSETVTLRVTESKSLQISMTNIRELNLSSGRLTIISQNENQKDTVVSYTFRSEGITKNEMGFTLDNALPSGEFLIAMEDAEGKVAVGRGTTEGDENDVNIDLNMHFARKQSGSGVDLHFEPPAEVHYDTPEEALAAEKEIDEKTKKWIEALKEEAQWHLDSIEREDEAIYDEEW